MAATGYRGPQFASEWLLNHVNDPTLDETAQREYILYLCPNGPLLEQIDKFYEESLKIGFNAAHNYLPHITLCSFFQAPDEAVTLLVNGLDHAVDKLRNDLPFDLKMEYYKTNQFIGLFLREDQNDIFKRLANVFMRECSEFISPGELGPMHVISTCFPWCSSYPSLHPKRIEVEPYLKSLHMTLAYQFDDAQRERLNSLVDSMVNPVSPCLWELKLFSREQRVKGCHVYRVLQPHEPSETDELQLIVGDFVYVHPSDLNNATDEWVNATSWLTGCTGQIPLSLTERTAESAAWTLHKTIVLAPHTNGCSHPSLTSPAIVDPLFDVNGRLRGSIDSADSSKTNTSETNASSQDSSRKLVVIRHGERIDFAFGNGWIPVCFGEGGVYKRRDLNQPESVPKRNDPFEFSLDTPLTVIGNFQASATGKALKAEGIKFSHVYVSPSLRCLQTAVTIIKEMNCNLPINVEPALFEWLSWYPPSKRPVFLTSQQMLENGININTTYEPLMTLEDLFAKETETLSDYYDRSFLFSTQVIKTTTGNILLVAHASSLDTCTRQMTGCPSRTAGDFLSLIKGIPYCGVSMIQEKQSNFSEDGDKVNDKLSWKLVKPPILTFQHSLNQKYEWKSLKT